MRWIAPRLDLGEKGKPLGHLKSTRWTRDYPFYRLTIATPHGIRLDQALKVVVVVDLFGKHHHGVLTEDVVEEQTCGCL